MESKPSFIQGVFGFEGAGLSNFGKLGGGATYRVPRDKRAQIIYLRAGNATDELIVLVLVRDGKPMRLFPVGAKQALHVQLAVTEDVFPESHLEVLVGAPKGLAGTAVVDLGLLEVD